MVGNTVGGLKDGKRGVEQKGIKDDLEEPKSWLLAVEVEKAGWMCFSCLILPLPSKLLEGITSSIFQAMAYRVDAVRGCCCLPQAASPGE